MITPADILEFWLGAPVVDPADFRDRLRRWFQGDPALDAEIGERFGEVVAAAQAGAFGTWEESPEGRLALVILLDQLSRNVYRGDPRAYAGDPRAQRTTLQALAAGDASGWQAEARMFLLMPLLHSEDPDHQGRCAAEQEALIADAPAPLRPLLAMGREQSAKAAATLQRFGRFPYRNAVLGRTSTPQEEAFLTTWDAGRAPAGMPEARALVIETTAGCGRTPMLRAALDQLGLAYTERVVADGTLFAAYHGPGPVLHDGGLALPQLGAALRYAARKAGALPEDRVALAELEGWMEVAHGLLSQFPHLLTAAREGRRSGAADQMVRCGLMRLEERLSRSAWLGEQRSVADVAALAVARLPQLGIALDEFPGVRAWCARSDN